MEAAKDEITLLQQIADGDPEFKKHCVHLIDSFELKGPNGVRLFIYLFFFFFNLTL
jgi:serine/threonine-protein kinase SRPK3